MKNIFVVVALIGLCELAAVAQGQNWVGTWAASPVGVAVMPNQPPPEALHTVQISGGGSAVRVQITNEFGTEPLIVEWLMLLRAQVSEQSNLRPSTR
jgi:hypothetical protein